MKIRINFVLSPALAIAALLVGAVPAYAGFDPISLTIESVIFALLTEVVSVSAALALTPFVFAAAAAAALYGVGVLLTPKTPGLGGGGTIDPGAAKATFESSAGPELRAVGRVRLGGLKAFGNTHLANRYRMTLHCKGEIDGVEEVYFGGRSVVADLYDTGLVSSFPWVKSGGSWAYFQAKTGTPVEAAWVDLRTDFPNLWSNDHRARGIAQSLARFVSPGLTDALFLKLYQSGIPEIEVLLRAEKAVYDPRTAATAWSENGILNAMHVLLSYPEFTLADFDLDFIAAEAARADVLVQTKGGWVPRARCWGVWSSETPRGDNMAKVLESIGAWIVPRDGGNKIGIQLIDDVPTAEVTIAARNIIEINWQSGPQGVERPNICRPKYYSPERNYDMGELDMSGIHWAKINDEVTAYGEKYLDLDLTFCPNSGQAQRRARQLFALSRADSGIIRTNMAGLAVWGCKFVAFEFPDDIGTLLTAIGAPRVLNDQGLVEIPFVVWPTFSAWDIATDEADAPEQIPDMAFGNPLTTPPRPSAATVVIYPVGGPATRVAYVIPPDALTVEASLRTYVSAASPNPWAAMFEYVAPGGYAHAYVAQDRSGIECDFRLRTFDGVENGSAWSAILNIVPEIDNSPPGATILDPIIAEDDPGSPPPPLPPTRLLYFDSIPVTVTAPDSLNVAYLTLTGPSAPTAPGDAIKPGEVVTWTAPATSGNNIFTAVANATDGTSVPVVSVEIAQSVTTGASLAARYAGGSTVITIAWKAPSTAGVVKMSFTGGGSPGVIAAAPNDQGEWTDSPVGAGTHTYTAVALNSVDAPIGTAASVTITI